jgi:hypothetical protein
MNAEPNSISRAAIGSFVEHTGGASWIGFAPQDPKPGAKGRVIAFEGGWLLVLRTDGSRQVWDPKCVRVLAKRGDA